MGCSSSSQANAVKTTHTTTTHTFNSANPNDTLGSLMGNLMAQAQQMQQTQMAHQQEKMQTDPEYRQLMERQAELQKQFIDAQASGNTAETQRIQAEIMTIASNPKVMETNFATLSSMQQGGRFKMKVHKNNKTTTTTNTAANTFFSTAMPASMFDPEDVEEKDTHTEFTSTTTTSAPATSSFPTSTTTTTGTTSSTDYSNTFSGGGTSGGGGTSMFDEMNSNF